MKKPAGKLPVKPFIDPASRPDTLKDMSDAPMRTLEEKIRYIIEQATAAAPNEKKDGKDGTLESPLTYGDAHLQLDEFRIKDDKLQSEKWKESTDKSETTEFKESCELRIMAIAGDPDGLDRKQIAAVEKFNVSRLGIKLQSGAVII